MKAISNKVEDMMVDTLKNGILQEQDTAYTDGIAPAKFNLPSTGPSLDDIFREHGHIDALKLVESDVKSVSQRIKDVIGSDHPVLETIAKYCFDAGGKRVRPSIVFLVAKAMGPAPPGSLATEDMAPEGEVINPKQRQLSEITEMIHTATLLHDDVIDEADTRRGAKSVNFMFGNKLAILGGDFLLARASVALARLRNCDVTELIGTALEHLVKGEVMQMKPRQNGDNIVSHIDSYITKSYYKTASLIAQSCKSVAILGGHDARTQEIAYEYGKSIGLAFQIQDDILDFVGTSKSLGKPALQDLKLGLATAPVLYAAEQNPHLTDMIARKFKRSGDVEEAVRCVSPESLERSQALASLCCENAVAAALELPPSEARSAMISLVQKVVTRER